MPDDFVITGLTDKGRAALEIGKPDTVTEPMWAALWEILYGEDMSMEKARKLAREALDRAVENYQAEK